MKFCFWEKFRVKFGLAGRPPSRLLVRFGNLYSAGTMTFFEKNPVWRVQVAAAMLSLCVPVRADEMDTFLEWQQKYQNFLKENGRPLYESYQKKLLELERSAAASRNYALSAKIKTERLNSAKDLGWPALESPASPSSETVTLEEDGSFTLEVNRAELGGGVSFNAETAALIGWTSDKAFARWKLPSGLRTGGYEVELIYSCGAADGGGRFILREDTFSLQREVRDSGSWQSFRPETCGTLHLKSASHQLVLSAAVVKGSGLFQLKQVKLMPVSPPSL